MSALRNLIKERRRAAAATACRLQGQRVCRCCGAIRDAEDVICPACGGKGLIKCS